MLFKSKLLNFNLINMTKKDEDLVWLYVKLNTMSSSISSTYEILKENKDASLGRQLAAFACFRAAIKYAEAEMPKIEEKIKSLPLSSMTKEERDFLKSGIKLKNSIVLAIDHFHSLDLNI